MSVIIQNLLGWGNAPDRALLAVANIETITEGPGENEVTATLTSGASIVIPKTFCATVKDLKDLPGVSVNITPKTEDPFMQS